MGREKGRAAQGWQFYASVIREGTGSPIKLPTRSGEGKEGEISRNAKKSRDQRAKHFYRSKSKNSHDENANK